MSDEFESITDLEMVLYEYGLDHVPSGSLAERCIETTRVIENIALSDPERAEEVLIGIIEEFLPRLSEFTLEYSRSISRLVASLNADSFSYSAGRLLPTTPEPAALAPQISQLEVELAEGTFETALAHYRQAVDSFTDGNFEAANGQLRSFLEDLFLELQKTLEGKTFDDASAALQHLMNRGHLDNKEGNLLRSFWQAIQDRGPHRGLTDPRESEFRLQVATAIARYSLVRLKPR